VPSAFGIRAKTVRKWIERHRARASEGLHDRSSRPHRLRAPETNGKAERFIQTALREWAYARAYQSSEQRLRDLPDWPHRYN